MTKTDNTLRAQTIMLAMKALEVISKVLDIIAADEATDNSHGIDTGEHGGDTDVSRGRDTDISHGTDTGEHGTDTDICHGTDTELTRRDTDEKRRDTDESLCAATPLPSRGGAGGGVCISLTDNKLVTPPSPPPLHWRGAAAPSTSKEKKADSTETYRADVLQRFNEKFRKSFP